ncbi:MAG: molybdenum cofactor guanylyltransferase MobA [Rhodospirillaceae bacterium]|nr:molybdenum cofactor guanylyltransferase MobA [Rhodospirillaceae bacterium]|tara:strand:- start:49407 stop:50030 length:624 start_codon:yes stop_codon:yes gene_type:complete
MPIENGVCGLLLAGGQSRRMGGGDKCLRDLAGQTLLSRVISCAKPQVEGLVLNANGNPARFEDYQLPVVADVFEGFAGPLAGILTGLEWTLANRPDCKWIASFACDAPFAPSDLVSRLLEAVKEEKGDLGVAVSGQRDQPVFGLWPVSLAADLRKALADEEVRKVDVWTARYKLVRVEWSTEPVDPFFNVNRSEDLDAAEANLSRLS